MIPIYPQIAEDIPFLNEKDTLFVLDYRALGESLEYEIPAMWKYENLAPWILKDQKVLVNEYVSGLKYPNTNHLFPVNCGAIAKESILGRAEQGGVLEEIKFDSIFAFVPHPFIDTFSQNKNKNLSYGYKDFLLLNNKITQKRLVSDTPSWKIIQNKNELEQIENKENFYIKRALGSGGFTVFKVEDITKNDKFETLLMQDKNIWYLEESIDGESMSIQLSKNKGEIVIFGITKQYIKDEKEFIGAEILPLSVLTEDIFLKEKLLQCIKELNNGLLGSYQGFWGIDFIYNKEQRVFTFLEGNIRLTAMTIPILLHNQNINYKIFKEDIEKDELKPKDLILSHDKVNDCYDILRLK